MQDRRKKRIKTIETEQKIIDFISRFKLTNGYSPNLRDIQQELDFGSASNVKYHIDRMLRDGLLNGSSKLARTLSVAGDDGFVRIPILGTIAAGTDFIPLDIPTSDQLDPDLDYLELPEDKFRSPASVYALHVQGDSMVDALIGDGDTVIVRKTSRARNGDMVATRITRDGEFDEFTLKHFYREGDRVELRPANPNMAPIELHASEVDVQGKVLSVIREY